MTSTQTAGWNVWAVSNEQVRHFNVAIAEEDKAIDALVTRYPELSNLTRERMHQQLISFLKLKAGDIQEWVAVGPGSIPQRGIPVETPMK